MKQLIYRAVKKKSARESELMLNSDLSHAMLHTITSKSQIDTPGDSRILNSTLEVGMYYSNIQKPENGLGKGDGRVKVQKKKKKKSQRKNRFLGVSRPKKNSKATSETSPNKNISLRKINKRKNSQGGDQIRSFPRKNGSKMIEREPTFNDESKVIDYMYLR